ncbi:hypothetical protein [Flavobacterium agrisoli]|uniref:Uncharacterized protein n=1 Tax=Flavobacterium agrisoli TaxID=2793066 RepID=A0A934UJN7_9FLAO|nr:hypothetical protein [Flavobacterium agrisoli]MBK0369693.1 hypothetical protein [Flavobacterium agrisoli]
MKRAIKHFFFLSVLLTFSNGTLFAHTLPLVNSAMYATSYRVHNAIIKRSHTNIAHLFDNHTSISDAVFETYVKKEILNSDNEEEDTENLTSKKAIDKISFCPSVFKTHITQTFFKSLKKPVAFCPTQSYLPLGNSRYLIFEVFRI